MLDWTGFGIRQGCRLILNGCFTHSDLQEQMEQEKELAKKKQAPVWRCAVCGRYGCPVAPYIESMIDVD